MTIFFFKQKTAYEISACLVGSEMCIRDRYQTHCSRHSRLKFFAEAFFQKGRKVFWLTFFSKKVSFKKVGEVVGGVVAGKDDGSGGLIGGAARLKEPPQLIGGTAADNGAVAVPDLSLIHISEPTRQAENSYAVFCF